MAMDCGNFELMFLVFWVSCSPMGENSFPNSCRKSKRRYRTTLWRRSGKDAPPILSLSKRAKGSALMRNFWPRGQHKHRSIKGHSLNVLILIILETLVNTSTMCHRLFIGKYYCCSIWEHCVISTKVIGLISRNHTCTDKMYNLDAL